MRMGDAMYEFESLMDHDEMDDHFDEERVLSRKASQFGEPQLRPARWGDIRAKR